MAPARKSTKAIKGKAGKKGAQLKGRIQKYAPKPKRPANGYAFFVKEFSQGKKLKGKDLIIGASKAWKRLSTEKQDEYKKRASNGAARYKEIMRNWRKQKQFLKKPPHAYGLFVRDFWKEKAKSSCHPDFGDTSKECAATWKALARGGRSGYVGHAGTLAKRFKKSLYALDHGADISILIETDDYGPGDYWVSSKDEDSDFWFYSESEDEDEEEDDDDSDDSEDEDKD